MLEMNTSEKLFVDTNIFIHALFDRYPQKHIKCVSLLKEAHEGKISLWTTELVIAEIVWFLTKQNFIWLKTKETITKFLFTKGLEVRSKEQILLSLDYCTKNKDFIDAMNVALAQAEEINKGYSYDKGLDRWKIIQRIEP